MLRSGVKLKTRKRNIVVPHDPQSFANAVIDVLNDSQDGGDLEATLEAAHKTLDSAELDYSRYGDVLFEVAFAGARLAVGTGATSTKESAASLPFCILKCNSRDEIVPYVKWFQAMIRRRPFLVKALENTMIKLILSLEFYDDKERKNIAIALSRCFVLKVGVLPERVLPAALEDRLVAKGTIGRFITAFFADYLDTESVESLVDLLRKARLQDRMLEFFPQQNRTWEDFNRHFVEAGLSDFVEYNQRKLYDAHCQELKFIVKEITCGEEPLKPSEVIETVKEKKTEWSIQDPDMVKSLYLGIVEGTLDSAGSKNTQQTQFAVLKNLKFYRKVLQEFCTSARLEAILMVTIQVTCYEDSRLLKLFADIIKVLYDVDIIGEDAIKFWYNKGSNPKGRNVFLKDLEPMVKWLDEAEEEEED